MALAAADLEERIPRGEGQQISDRAGELRLEAARQEAPARRDGGGGVARPGGAAVLGLEQVDVAAAGHVEGMRARAGQALPLPRERKAAAADRAEQGDQAYRPTVT